MRLNKEIRQKIVGNAYKASPIPAVKPMPLALQTDELNKLIGLPK